MFVSVYLVHIVWFTFHFQPALLEIGCKLSRCLRNWTTPTRNARWDLVRFLYMIHDMLRMNRLCVFPCQNRYHYSFKKDIEKYTDNHFMMFIMSFQWCCVSNFFTVVWVFLCLLKETEFRWVAGRDHQQVAFWKWMLHFQDTGISWRSIAYHSFWEWDTKWCNQPLVNTSKWKCAPRVWSKYQPKTKQTPFLDSGCIHLQVSRARAGLRPRVHGSWSGNMPPPGGHCHPGKTSTTSKLIPDQCCSMLELRHVGGIMCLF